jgi:hypothetical protein
MAYRYANIEKYLHGIAFKEGSHMPCGQGLLARFAIWPPCFKQTDGRSEPRIEQFMEPMFLEDVRRDEWQLVNGFTEFRGPCFALQWTWSRFRWKPPRLIQRGLSDHCRILA